MCNKFFVSRDRCVAVFGAVDARENGTTDQSTRATKTTGEQKPPRMWNERTPVTHQRGSAGPLSPAALSGSRWLLVAFLNFFRVARGSSKVVF